MAESVLATTALKTRLRDDSEKIVQNSPDMEIRGSSHKFFHYQELQPHTRGQPNTEMEGMRFVFEDYSTMIKLQTANRRGTFLFCPGLSFPLVNRLQKKHLRVICAVLDITATHRTTVRTLRQLIHDCKKTPKDFGLIFKSHNERKKPENSGTEHERPRNDFGDDSFPPGPPTKRLQEKIVNDWCDDLSSDRISEQGCSVCGILTPICVLINRNELKNIDFSILKPQPLSQDEDVTRKERRHETEPVAALDGPVLDDRLQGVCELCIRYLEKKKVPPFSMAAGFWLGDVPEELSCLSFAEKLLIAKSRSNNFIVRVKSGRYKLRGNAITFPSPVSKVYNVLPPHRAELEQILAFIFVGPQRPTAEELSRVPLLVRKNRVAKALDWLKLNHVDYEDLQISSENIESYRDNEIPVSVTYRPSSSDTNKDPESTATYDNDDDEGVEKGECPFVVHGLTIEQLENLDDVEIIKAIAVRGLQTGQGVLAIGRSDDAENTFLNPQLYPKMFPWLFPYGLGGLQNLRGFRRSRPVSDLMWKRHLLMFHDKRFQLDRQFALVALNHEQLKQSSTGAHLMTQRAYFPEVVRRIANVNAKTLSDLALRLRKGELVTPCTEDERICYELINDVDVVSYKVYGALTCKRFMRNEIWSLACFRGAPTWFITFAPPDNKNPICLFFADTGEIFEPRMRSYDEKYRLIAENPVASARYFNFMVELFIKHVLGVDSDHPGLFGITDAYFGTVEQQGRLTLHLHLLLWIHNNLTPAEIRSRLTSDDSEFQTKMIVYLDALCVGQFATGTMDEVRTKVRMEEQSSSFDPIESLPERVPLACRQECGSCDACIENQRWWDKFPWITDYILCKSNVHRCSQVSCRKDGVKTCKARFPRRVVEESKVLPDGAVELRKSEEYLNTFSPLISYLLRGNTDVTSLLSGTAIKAVVKYVTDYITKSPLKSHALFESVRNVLLGFPSLEDRDQKDEKTKAMLLKVVNSMTAQLEIGSPLACSYLLGFPDHYTSHKFVPFYWKTYIPLVDSAFEENSPGSEDLDKQQVIVMKCKNKLVPYSNILDYIYRPTECENCSLYDWYRRYKKGYIPKNNKSDESVEDDFGEDDQDREEATDVQAEHEDPLTNTRRTGRRRVHTERFLESCAQEDDLSFLDDPRLFDEVSKPSKTFRLLPQHPQHSTRLIREIPEDDAPVPNFVNYPPRRDSDDPEFYYKTMLTIFKPWRTGLDLKTDHLSWSHAFDNHEFTERERRMMNFFEIKYECLDSKDDYYAQRRRNNPRSGEEDDEDLLLDAQAHFNDIADEFLHEDHVAAMTQDTVLAAKKKIEDSYKDNMAIILDKSGWSAPLTREESPDPVPERLSETVQNCTKDWSDALQRAKCEMLNNMRAESQTPQMLKRNLPKSWEVLGEIRVIDILDLYSQKYTSYACRADGSQTDALDFISEKFSLNKEQRRAFRIIGEHCANESTSEQLLMYIAGPAGTGKTQIIKAVLTLFLLKSQSYKMKCVAPTGSAAALIGGSTYHSFLGIITSWEDGPRFLTKKQQAEVRERLKNVRYIFLDEVSMVSCQDFYKISAQLARFLGERSLPFGGVNMIFAGDFAQLPPPFGTPLYHVPTESATLRGQMASIGKALWEQVKTVVVLKQNMRQKDASKNDHMLRKALGNMRFGKCDENDILFLRTLVAGPSLGKPSMACKKFRHVSIITAWNIHRDYINQRGAENFADQHKVPLHFFYSHDTIPKTRNTGVNSSPSRSLTDEDRIELWNMDPAKSKNFPGRLPICRGMPVMIRKNLATECCVTNGAEGVVVDWISEPLPGDSPLAENKRTLSTLFIKLVRPPKNIVIGNLPENVVPIPSVTESISCQFLSGEQKTVKRSQVYVTLNFAMTDYNSQGRTRTMNPVHLAHCKSQQGIYTSLSRGASAEGTILLSEFDRNKIQMGISGFLRQEFRYLEVLDEINRRIFEGEMQRFSTLQTRGSVVDAFFDMFPEYTRIDVHPEIKWTSRRNFQGLLKRLQRWKLIDNDNQIQEQSDQHLVSKRKELGTETDRNCPNAKRTRLKPNNVSPLDEPATQPTVSRGMCSSDSSFVVPRGVTWLNWSCAYDAVLPVLFHVWCENENIWNAYSFSSSSYRLNRLSFFFNRVKTNVETFESVRDSIRRELNHSSPLLFPLGQTGTGVHNLVRELLSASTSLFTKFSSCSQCGERNSSPTMTAFIDMEPPTFEFGMFCTSNYVTPFTIQNWFTYFLRAVNFRCFACRSIVNSEETDTRLWNLPYIIGFRNISSHMFISPILLFSSANGTFRYKLRGVVYHGDNHYTSSVIDKQGMVWHGDGMQNNGCYFLRSSLSNMDQDALFRVQQEFSCKYACVLIYVLEV